MIDAALLARFLILTGNLIEQMTIAGLVAMTAIKAVEAVQAVGFAGDSWTMRQEADVWQVAGQLATPEIVNLNCLLTLLERDQTGWDVNWSFVS